VQMDWENSWLAQDNCGEPDMRTRSFVTWPYCAPKDFRPFLSRFICGQSIL